MRRLRIEWGVPAPIDDNLPVAKNLGNIAQRQRARSGLPVPSRFQTPALNLGLLPCLIPGPATPPAPIREIYGNHQQLLVDSGDTLWLVLLPADLRVGLRISFVCKELQASQS